MKPDIPGASSGSVTRSTRPMLTVAVIGSGPAGIFAAGALLQRPDTRVDIFDRLPCPFGLIRYGVAPDQVKIKSLTTTLSSVLANPRVEFYGNVQYGTDLIPEDLADRYDSVIFATGSAIGKRLQIPGNHLPGSYTGAEVVAWYNGHPFAETQFDTSVRSLAIVGGGNVSLDIARVLLKGRTALAGTDIPAGVLAALGRSRIADVYIVARRGSESAKFSPSELRGLESIEDLDIRIEDPGASVGSGPENPGTVVQDRQGVELQKIFRHWGRRPATGAARRLHFLFQRSPMALLGTERVEGLRLQQNDSEGRAQEALTPQDLPVQAVISSIGFAAEPLPGISFDADLGRVPSERGRVSPGIYVAGWIKRGPVGLVGWNKRCAHETVDQLLADVKESRPRRRHTCQSVRSLLAERGCQVVSWRGWTKIDATEIRQGRIEGRDRSKIADHRQLIEIGAGAGGCGPRSSCRPPARWELPCHTS